MKIKKYTALLCAACIAISSLAACSSVKASSMQPPEETPTSDAENYFEKHLDEYLRLGGTDGFVSGSPLETVHYSSAQKSSYHSDYTASLCTLPVRLRVSECILSPETERCNYFLLAANVGGDEELSSWLAERIGRKLITAETEFIMPVIEKGSFFATAMTGGIADAASGRAVELQDAAHFADITLNDGVKDRKLRCYPLGCLNTDYGILCAVTALEVCAPEKINGELRQRWTFITQVISPSDYEDISFYYGGSDMSLEQQRESFDGKPAHITQLPQYEYNIHFFGPQSPIAEPEDQSAPIYEASPANLAEHSDGQDINYIFLSEGKDGCLITEGAKLGIDAALMATGYIGGNYKWGASSPETGFDCSGLVYHVYGELGYPIARTANDQAKEGTHVEPEALRTGDILCFHYGNGYCDHAGIYLGNGGFVHAASSDTGIVISMLSDYCSRGRKLEARRLLP